MRKNFDQSLDRLNEDIIEMGDLATEAIKNSMIALEEKNIQLAKEVVDGDIIINQKEKDIEAGALNILLREQPVAHDLRFVTSALKMITDIERIGDQASDISYLNVKMSKRNYEVEDLGSIIDMAKMTITMVEQAIRSHVTGDEQMAIEVIGKDIEVDNLFLRVRKEVIDDIKSEKLGTKNSLDMLMIAKYLERIGDHAENIARRVYFSLKGEHYEG